MSKVTMTVSMDRKFADKFLNFLANLAKVNGEKKKPFKIESVVVDDDIVAYPKEET